MVGKSMTSSENRYFLSYIGIFSSAPTVASGAANRLNVFIQGADDQLLHKAWD